MEASININPGDSNEINRDIKASSDAFNDFYSHKDPWLSELISTVEQKLHEVVSTDIQLAEDVGKHMLFGCAKRLRLLFVLLGQLLFKDTILKSSIDCAAATELIHCASLFHDDVIDNAKTRKRCLSANEIWGNKSAVIMGDRFFILAYSLITQSRDFTILDIFVDTCRALAEGILLETSNTGDLNISEETHLNIVNRKTATFFANSARLGAYLAGAGESEKNALYRMGLNFGMAFQLSDDLLDLYGDPRITGKPRGADLMSKVYTIPLIYSLSKDSEFSKTFRPVLSRNGLTPHEIDQIADCLIRNGSVEYSNSLIMKFCDSALQELDTLPANRANDALKGLVKRVRDRQYVFVKD